MTFVETEHIIA